MIEAFQELSVLKGSVLLDASSFESDDFVDGLLTCLQEVPDLRVLLKGLRSFDQFSRLKELSVKGLSLVLDSDQLVSWFKKDYEFMVDSIASGFLSGSYSSKGLSFQLNVLKQSCQLDTISVAKVLGGTYCQLVSPEFLDWSVNDKPNVVLDLKPELMVFREGVLVN